MKLLRFEPSALVSAALSSCTSTLPSGNEVHLWILRENTLLGFEKKRQALRAILSHYTSIPPELLRFEELEDGKPVLASDQNLHRLHFNLSHTSRIQLIALSCSGEIGVDVEKIRPREKMSAFMDRYFFASEKQRVEACAPENQLRAFFEVWTAKEAWAKARGKSVFRAFSQYEWKAQDPSMSLIDLGPEFVAHLSLNSQPANR
jgi:4'-phosphopantetheinyl transferase